ncbi:MAG: hypothetical protein IPG72_14555 [Ardenticatenales bacterium]|nr:hypothetical protein [Ardenticatenales bacterium]
MDLATLWDPMKADEPGAFAFRAYRNYDGAGARFGETGLHVAPLSTANADSVSLYAALRAIDDVITFVAVNKTSVEEVITVAVKGTARRGGRRFVYDGNDLARIHRYDDVYPGGYPEQSVQVTLPPMSITTVELWPGIPEWTETPRPTAGATSSATPTPSSPGPTATRRDATQSHVYLPYGRR